MKQWTYKGVLIKHMGRNMYYHYNKAGKLICSNRLSTAKSYIDKDTATREWMIEFDFFENKPMAIKMGFETEDKAIDWALEHNVIDYVVSWYEEV